MGDSIRLFCLKSFYSLFTNMMQNQEIAFSILDLLFLYGNPTMSKTFFDDDIEFPPHIKEEIKKKKEKEANDKQLKGATSNNNILSTSQGSVNPGNLNQNSNKSRIFKDSQFEPCMVGCPYTERWKDPKELKEQSKTARCYVDRTT